MKKIITILVMLTSMQSQGVHLSEDGTGQVLIFPYYTVNGGFNSLLTITNTTERAKALRVRFREAANSREVFTFNLYLGANDVWVAGLVKREDSTVELITPDNSCTVPDLHSQQNLFSKSHFTNDMLDAYGNNNNRLFEGFVEVIEMGELTGNSELAATFVELGIQPPYNCNDLVNAWDANHADNYWIQDANTDLLPPRGGVSGDLTLINVPQGIAMNAKPTVIENFSYEVLHHSIGSDSPSLADGMLISRVVDMQGRYFDMTWDSGIKALSSVLMVSSFDNEYEVNADFGAKTTLISTLPTKQYFTDSQYTNQAPVAPFTQALGTGTNAQLSCEDFTEIGLYNREATEPSPPVGQVPGGPPIFEKYTKFCYAVNASPIDFEASNFSESIFGSKHIIIQAPDGEPSNTTKDRYTKSLVTPFHRGWMQLSFSQSMTQGNNTLKGLPMIGFAAQKYVNSNLSGGVLANYAAIAEHNTQLEIDSQETPLADSAMRINADGTGQVLIYPYYTVKNGFNSLIYIVNTSDELKAVRVKFREGNNARDVLDFNLYLSPYDVWTAQLKAVESTVNDHVGEPSALLQTSDTSCLVPNNISLPTGQEFFPYNYELPYDEKGHSLERTQEGFIEVIEMGSLTREDAENATHVAGVPPSCVSLEQNWQGGGKWFTNPNQDIQAPDGSGDLHGSLNLISVADGIDMKYDAVAIANYSTQAQHSHGGTTLPDLTSGNNSTTSIENNINGSLLTTTWDSPLDAVSALFMHDTTSNQYDINPSVGAQTDWVIMSPTRHYYTDKIYDANNPKSPYGSGLTPNETDFCQRFGFKSYNREQVLNTVSGAVPSPNPPGNYDQKQCYSINVSFADDNPTFSTPETQSIFNSQLLTEDWIIFNGTAPIYHMTAEEGVLFMNLDDGDRLKGHNAGDNTESHTIYGKPIISFTAQKYVNGKLAGGVLANYSIIKGDTTTRKIEVVAPAQ